MDSRTEQPIIFSTDTVRAILAGRKWMTRRAITPRPVLKRANGGLAYYWKEHECFDIQGLCRYCPYGQIGDKLWVRETFYIWQDENNNPHVRYKSDWTVKPALFRWKSPLFMPKRAARIWLEITGLRVERLQDITKDDAIAEGMLPDIDDPIEEFAQSARGYLWYSNPFCWVLSFKKGGKGNADMDLGR